MLCLQDAVQRAYDTGKTMWDEVLWKSDEHAWESVETSSLEQRLAGGLALFFEEVEACYSSNGGLTSRLEEPASSPFADTRTSLRDRTCFSFTRQGEGHRNAGMVARIPASLVVLWFCNHLNEAMGSALALGSRTLESINRSASIIPEGWASG